MDDPVKNQLDKDRCPLLYLLIEIEKILKKCPSIN